LAYSSKVCVYRKSLGSDGRVNVGEEILILASWYPENASRLTGIFIQDQAEVLSQAYDVCVLAARIVGAGRGSEFFCVNG